MITEHLPVTPLQKEKKQKTKPAEKKDKEKKDQEPSAKKPRVAPRKVTPAVREMAPSGIDHSAEASSTSSAVPAATPPKKASTLQHRLGLAKPAR